MRRRRPRRAMAAGDLAWAWACLKQSGNYRAAWQALAARSRYENDTPFPVRIRSGADRIAERDWSLFAWEDPDGDALSAFFADAPMPDGEGSASARRALRPFCCCRRTPGPVSRASGWTTVRWS